MFPCPVHRESVRKVSRKQLDSKRRKNCCLASIFKTVWPSGLRRWLQAPVRKGVGSNPTAVTLASKNADICSFQNLHTNTKIMQAPHFAN